MIWPCPFKITSSPLKECFPEQNKKEGARWFYEVILILDKEKQAQKLVQVDALEILCNTL